MNLEDEKVVYLSNRCIRKNVYNTRVLFYYANSESDGGWWVVVTEAQKG